MSEQYKYQPDPNDPLSYLPPNADDWKEGGRYYSKWKRLLTTNGQTDLNEAGYLNALEQYQKGNRDMDRAQGNANIDSSYDPRTQAMRQLAGANKEAREERVNTTENGSTEDKQLAHLREIQRYQSAEAEKEFGRSKELIRITQEEARKNQLTPDQQIDITTKSFKNTNPFVIERINAASRGQTDVARINADGQIKSSEIVADANKYGSLMGYKGQVESSQIQADADKYGHRLGYEAQMDANAKGLEGTKYESDTELSSRSLDSLVKGYTDSMGNAVNRIANIFSLKPDANMVWRAR